MTKTQFLEKYRDALIARCDWASDPARLDRFMQSVETTVRTERNPWRHDGEIVGRLWRAAGFKGRLTLKALRALPDGGDR